MKDKLKKIIETSIKESALIEEDLINNFEIEINQSTRSDHGDFSSNIALKISGKTNIKPLKVAEIISETIQSPEWLTKIEVAPPGFINFFVDNRTKADLLISIIEQESDYGSFKPNSEDSILLEFVSSNPTGPLHVGHGRHAAYGDSLAKILRKAGYNVSSEYYINDSGRQIDILILSVVVALINKNEILLEVPGACYKGSYIGNLIEVIPKKAIKEIDKLSLSDLKIKEADDDSEADALISVIKSSVGESIFEEVTVSIVDEMVKIIKSDLSDFGVEFNHWFSEKNMIKNSKIPLALKKLKTKKALFKKDGATWLKTTDYGDDKDRVVLRDDGRSTYFASDIAYHSDKKDRGFDTLINILGSDHHGYINRLKGGLASMDHNPEDLEIVLMQFVTLYRGKKKVQMSTRSGEFIPMRELYKEVGIDAARFIYVSRSYDQHLDFDLELAKEQSNLNPVYYIQYANARICSVIKEIEKKGYKHDYALGIKNIGSLVSKHESELISMLQKYPDTIKSSADQRAVNKVSNYLKDIAQLFHSYYGAQKFIIDGDETRNARIILLRCVSIVIKDGLSLLGVSSPSKM
tara:strand:- start:674 stop:2413 length:1740 start_codon:yes stop_codon:yes gene_type:complete